MATTSPTRPDSPGVIRSLIPARIDRLPWSRFHTRLVIALGVAWVLATRGQTQPAVAIVCIVTWFTGPPVMLVAPVVLQKIGPQPRDRTFATQIFKIRIGAAGQIGVGENIHVVELAHPWLPEFIADQ